MNPADTPNSELERNERVLEAVKLRRQGKAYHDIAKEMGVSQSTAYGYVQRHYKDLAKLATEELDHVRAQELARLDAWLEAIERRMQRAEEFTVGDDGIAKFDVDIAKLVLAGAKLQERRAKLLGLDAPTKVDHTIDDQRKKLAEMTAEERIALHEQAIAEERARLAGGMH